MRFAIFGVGGLGGYFGGKLVQAGEDVVFISRGKTLEALRTSGLTVNSAHGDFHVAVRATDDPASVGPVDALLFLVKTYQNDEAAKLAAPLVGERTAILSLQNGVGNAERVRDAVGRGHALGGLAYIESAMAEPGVVRQPSKNQRVLVGELDGRPSPLVDGIVGALVKAGVGVEGSTRIVPEMWTKWIFICAFSGLTTVCRTPIGPVRTVPETRALYLATLREVEAVARAKKVALAADVFDRLVAQTDGFEPGAKSSMLRDAERGRPLEVDALNGEVARFGRGLGVPTPANEFLYAALLPTHRAALRD